MGVKGLKFLESDSNCKFLFPLFLDPSLENKMMQNRRARNGPKSDFF